MPVPTNKKELISEIKSTYQKLRADLEAIPEKLAQMQNLEGHAKGTKMSICNLNNLYFKVLFFWHTLIYPSKQDKCGEKYIDFL